MKRCTFFPSAQDSSIGLTEGICTPRKKFTNCAFGYQPSSFAKCTTACLCPAFAGQTKATSYGSRPLIAPPSQGRGRGKNKYLNSHLFRRDYGIDIVAINNCMCNSIALRNKTACSGIFIAPIRGSVIIAPSRVIIFKTAAVNCNRTGSAV